MQNKNCILFNLIIFATDLNKKDYDKEYMYNSNFFNL